MEELHNVLWTCKTTLQKTIRYAIFMLTFGHEVVILVKISKPSPQLTNYDLEENDERINIELDTLEKDQENSYTWA